MPIRKVQILISVVSLAFGLVACEKAAIRPDQAATAEQAAIAGIQQMNELVTPETFKPLGFDSMDDAAHASLEAQSPFPLRFVMLNDLMQFEPGTDPKNLLHDAKALFYPITVKGEVRSSLTVTFSEEHQTWSPTAWGGSSLIRRLTKYRKSSSSFAVWLPGPNLYLLGDSEQGKLMLTPIADLVLQQFKFEAGQSYPAQEVFMQLRETAKIRRLNEPGKPIKPG